MPSLVIMTCVVVVALTEVKSVSSGSGLTGRPVLGGFLLGVLLFAFESINSEVTRKLCILIMVAALLYNGNTIAKALELGNLDAVKKTASKTPAPPPSSSSGARPVAPQTPQITPRRLQ